MGDITATLMGKDKEVAEMVKKVMKKLKEEVEKKGLMSVTEDEKSRCLRRVVSWRMSCANSVEQKW